jgi:diaminopimelate epimerase
MKAPNVVPFVKATACGNDFLIIEALRAPADLAGITRWMCDRHMGVGADGVEWLFPTKDADIHARLFNADGGEAELSGNGTRCVASYLLSGGLNNDKVTIRTGAGLKTCTLTRRDGNEFEFEMEMGEPEVGDEFSLKLAFAEISGIPVDMGNPQFIVFVDDFLPGWQAEAGEICRHHDFEHGTNVEFVRVRDRSNIDIHIFERGVGETQSSGTGSCASAVAAIATGKADSPLRVHAPGGIQIVRWQEQVFLRGPARLLCRGEFLL